MKKSFRLLLSLVLVVCMALALTVPAFAAETKKVTFNGLEDIVFVYGGKELSMAEETNVSKLSVSVMNQIWKHFSAVAEKDSLKYTTETKDKDFVITINDKTFVSVFQLKNVTGVSGYISVQVLAAEDGKEIDSVKLYFYRGDVTDNKVDLKAAEASVDVKLGEEDAAIVTLNSSVFSFFNAPKGFTFSAGSNDVTSRGEFAIHYRYLLEAVSSVSSAPAQESKEESKEESEDEPAAPEKPQDEIIPYKNFRNLIDHPSENKEFSVTVNSDNLGVQGEVGDRGWAVRDSDGNSGENIYVTVGGTTIDVTGAINQIVEAVQGSSEESAPAEEVTPIDNPAPNPNPVGE